MKLRNRLRTVLLIGVNKAVLMRCSELSPSGVILATINVTHSSSNCSAIGLDRLAKISANFSKPKSHNFIPPKGRGNYRGPTIVGGNYRGAVITAVITALPPR